MAEREKDATTTTATAAAEPATTDYAHSVMVTMPMKVHAPETTSAFVVWESELLAYERAVSETASAAGFCSFCAGAALTLITTLATATLSTAMFALFGAILVAVVLVGIQNALRYFAASRAKRTLSAKFLRRPVPPPPQLSSP